MKAARRIAVVTALAGSVFLTGCVAEGYYGEVGWGGPAVYEPYYPRPYYGDYYPRYDRYYYRQYDRRYDRRYERPKYSNHAARPDYPRPARPDYPRPSRPEPVVVQPQPAPQPPPAQPRPTGGLLNCGGAVDASGLCDPRGRGQGWGKMQ